MIVALAGLLLGCGWWVDEGIVFHLTLMSIVCHFS